MIYKRDITNAPAQCSCEMTELPNLVGGAVKGYTETKTCPVCAALYATQAADAQKRQAEQEKQRKIRERANADAWTKAETDLKSEGKL